MEIKVGEHPQTGYTQETWQIFMPLPDEGDRFEGSPKSATNLSLDVEISQFGPLGTIYMNVIALDLQM